MELSAAPALVPRTVPVNVTMAPMSVRPAGRAALSRETWKSAVWTATLTVSASRHGRKEADLACTGDRRLVNDMRVVYGGADDIGALEGVRVLGTARLEPPHELADSAYARRHVQHFFGAADALS